MLPALIEQGLLPLPFIYASRTPLHYHSAQPIYMDLTLSTYPYDERSSNRGRRGLPELGVGMRSCGVKQTGAPRGVLAKGEFQSLLYAPEGRGEAWANEAWQV